MKSIYCIKDVKGGFINPFTMANDQLAERAFKGAFMNNDEPMTQFPEDYELWKLGEFDDRTGAITPKAEMLITGIEAFNSMNNRKKVE